jgi:succinate-acetate transporter protein
MWEFRNRNIFGATAFSAYGAFWLGLGILIVFQVVGRPTGGPLYTGDGAIWYLFLWAVFTTYMWVITLRTNAVVMAIFLLLALALWALWLGAKGGDLPGHGWTGFGGILGFLTAAVAFYGSFAGVINTVWGRAVAPVFPLTRG